MGTEIGNGVLSAVLVQFAPKSAKTMEDVDYNTDRILEFMDRAVTGFPGIDMIVFPECCFQGMCPNLWIKVALKMDSEPIRRVQAKCRELGVNAALSEVWAKGGQGGLALAEEVVRLCESPNEFRFAYDVEAPIEEKLNDIVRKIYHADGAELTAAARKQMGELEELGFGKLPICMAKTQYSFSDDAAKLGAPSGFTVTVRNLKVSAGAGFLVALTGDIMTMPGLPKAPAAEKIDVDENGRITGLF